MQAPCGVISTSVWPQTDWYSPVPVRRHYHPSPPPRTVKQERTFEGISLDQPGSSSRQVEQHGGKQQFLRT